MVWMHTPPQSRHFFSHLGPWLGRLTGRAIARLRAAAIPAPLWTEAYADSQDAPLTALPLEEPPGPSEFTRVEPIHALDMPAPSQFSPKHAQTLSQQPMAKAEAGAASMSKPLSPSFHAIDIEDIPVAFVLSHRVGSGLPCLNWLADHGVPFRRIVSLAPSKPVWSAPVGAMLLVDLDTLGGIAVMAEALMRLRLLRPDISVILLSEEVASHDFGTERLALADITLRLPCAFASFEFALAEAPINNAVWQSRLVTLHA